MAFFNSKTPKRASLWSNSKQIRKFWLGKLTKEIRQSLKKNNPDFKTTVTYVDSQGKKRFHGTKSLRSTQNLGLKKSCVCWWALCFLWHIDNPRAFTFICNQGHILVNFLSRWPRTFCPTWRMNSNNLLPSAGKMQPRNSRPCGMRPKALATPGTMQSFGMWHDICWGQKAFVYHQNGNGLFHLICELRTIGLVQKRVIDLALAKYRSIVWWRRLQQSSLFEVWFMLYLANHFMFSETLKWPIYGINLELTKRHTTIPIWSRVPSNVHMASLF